MLEDVGERPGDMSNVIDDAKPLHCTCHFIVRAAPIDDWDNEPDRVAQQERKVEVGHLVLKPFLFRTEKLVLSRFLPNWVIARGVVHSIPPLRPDEHHRTDEVRGAECNFKRSTTW